jgi:inhibitor of cysteine peptidase
MKSKSLLLLILLLILVLAAGCSGGGPKTYTDPTETISVNANDEFVIALESNPTTGFAWEAEYDGDLLTINEHSYEPDENAEEMVGVGGTDLMRFKALKAGTTQIMLTYSQPWEEEEGEFDEHLTFNVEIK